MLELTKKVLTRVSFDRRLFKKELLKSRKWLNNKEAIILKTWALATFGHVYKDLILEAYNSIA